MQIIDRPLNPELLKIVDPFVEWFFSFDRSLINVKGERDQNEYHTSEEYLNTIDKTKHIGFPEITHGIDLTLVESTPMSFREKIIAIDHDLNSFFGAKFCAVKMYYPSDGYMGWHTNWNCHGYNILLSYNREGKGYFRYKDSVSGETVTQSDKQGWQAKVGYFGKKDEPDKVVWHCARSYSERITFGYVIPDENMWQMMIEDL